MTRKSCVCSEKRNATYAQRNHRSSFLEGSSVHQQCWMDQITKQWTLSYRHKKRGPDRLVCLTPPLIERIRLLHSTAATKQEHKHTYRSKEEEEKKWFVWSNNCIGRRASLLYLQHVGHQNSATIIHSLIFRSHRIRTDITLIWVVWSCELGLG
jgi:hypothetical protein